MQRYYYLCEISKRIEVCSVILLALISLVSGKIVHLPNVSII